MRPRFHNSGHLYGAALIYALAGFPEARFAAWLSRCCRSPRGTTQTPERWGMVLNYSARVISSIPCPPCGVISQHAVARRGAKARSCTCPASREQELYWWRASPAASPARSHNAYTSGACSILSELRAPTSVRRAQDARLSAGFAHFVFAAGAAINAVIDAQKTLSIDSAALCTAETRKLQ